MAWKLKNKNTERKQPSQKKVLKSLIETAMSKNRESTKARSHGSLILILLSPRKKGRDFSRSKLETPANERKNKLTLEQMRKIPNPYYYGYKARIRRTYPWNKIPLVSV